MFHVTTRLDYGILILRSLAVRNGSKPVPLSVIASENELPYSYLANIAVTLKRAGLVSSYEGVRGGYRLTRRPERITLFEIARVLAPQQRLNRCLRTDHDRCRLAKSCSMAPWWFHFNVRFSALIQKIKLSDFV